METYPIPMVPGPVVVPERIRNVYLEPYGSGDLETEFFELYTGTQRRLKSIFIHAFQDAETFNLARVRRCCNAYPQADGRLIPVCVHNLRGRESAHD
jgi:hypothetical protein